MHRTFVITEININYLVILVNALEPSYKYVYKMYKFRFITPLIFHKKLINLK